MACIIIGLAILACVALWVAVQLVRNGGAQRVDHWKNATTERHDFGDRELGYEPLMSEPPPAPKAKRS